MARVTQEKDFLVNRMLLLYQEFKRIWEWFSLIVLSINSFIMLYHRSTQNSIQYVVCFCATGYFLVLFFQTIFYRKSPDRRMRILKLSQKVFRLIYTAIYLTSIMMNIVATSQIPNCAALMAYYGLTFIWAAAWGTNCFWLSKLIRLLNCSGKSSKGENC